MQKYNILWADDEIDLLKPHIFFLERKGHHIVSVNNGSEALEKSIQMHFDIIFLDENMPGLTGLETLNKIKSVKPNIPVVMITKSEEEYLMEEAIGSKIADYLIKPINPNQILLSLKKNLDKNRIISEQTNLTYQQEFQKINMMLSDQMNYNDWISLYQQLVYWDLAIHNTEYRSMGDILEMQKREANIAFSKFIMRNYGQWLHSEKESPIFSHQLLKKKVFPLLEETGSLFLILIDNLRYDQWKILEPILSQHFNIQKEEPYYSILPTTTGYARNAIFSGMMPYNISKYYPQWWFDDSDEEGKNNFENELLQAHLKRWRINIKPIYHKVIRKPDGKNVLNNISNMLNNKLNIIIYNFVDMLSHARTDTNMIQELAPDEAAYRSITRSWFEHSSLLEVLKILNKKKVHVVITTDHGTIQVKRPIKIIGSKDVNSNLRYKHGKNLSYEQKEVFENKKPEYLFLPKKSLSSAYIFAVENCFFTYPNNYNHYVKYYKDTFQHGGISLEEMIIPFAVLSST